MLKKIISAVLVVGMAIAMFPMSVSAAVAKTETATGRFYCTFENNDYDTHVKSLRGVAADNTWGMSFPIINEIIEKKVSFDTVKSVSITVKASNTDACSKGVTPKIELHWNTRDNNDGSVTSGFENGIAKVSGTLPAGTRQIVLNPYAFSASAGEITFEVTVDITYEEPTVEPESGYIGYPNATDIQWVLSEDGTLTFSGKGAMRPLNDRMWYFADKPIRKIVIEEGITSIGSYVFQKCDKVKSVEIASSVTMIGMYAFDMCWEINSVKMSKGVTRINNCAFRCCNKLEEIQLPDTLTYIGNNCFEKCISLTSITIPSSVKSMGTEVFYDCSALTEAVIGDGITTIGKGTFSSCRALKSVTLPNNLEKIGESAFAWCNNLEISTLPGSVTAIDKYAFNSCSKITEITVPDSVKTIGERAFQNCEKLKKLIIPSSETSFASNVTLFSDNVTIYGRSGSVSQEWANTNDVPFVAFEPEQGDVSGEGKTDLYDLELIKKHITGISILSGGSFARADMNGDSIVDIRDYNLLYAKIM